MSKSKIPNWIKVFGWILGVFGIILGIISYVAPDMMVPGMVTDSPANTQAMGMLGGRNIAMGITIIVALLSKKTDLLMLAFIMRFATEIQDMVVSMSTGIMGVPAVALGVVYIALFIIPEILAIKKLREISTNS